MGAPGFWDNQEKAQQTVSQLKSLAAVVKPLDVARITSLAKRCRVLVTVEEHSGMGGFGAAVLEALAQAGVQIPSRCLAIPDRLIEHGNTGSLLSGLGLDAKGIVESVTSLLQQAERGQSRGDGGAPPRGVKP